MKLDEDADYTCSVPQGTPHAVTEEDSYRGYRIPKGSTIIAPLWGIHLNPKDVGPVGLPLQISHSP